MKKVYTIGFLKVSITNRGIYTLSLFALAAILAILVYAISPGQPLSPGQTPNPGHPPNELGIPSPCASGQFLEYNGSGWVCGGASSPWTKNGNNIYNSNTGNVGIGTTNPTGKLEVNGRAGATSFKVASSFTDLVNNAPWYGIGVPNFVGDNGGVPVQLAGYGGIYLRSANGHMVLSSNGNVGIGTTAPGAKLDVAGNVKANDFYIAKTGKWASSLGGSCFRAGNKCIADGTTISASSNLYDMHCTGYAKRSGNVILLRLVSSGFSWNQDTGYKEKYFLGASGCCAVALEFDGIDVSNCATEGSYTPPVGYATW